MKKVKFLRCTVSLILVGLLMGVGLIFGGFHSTVEAQDFAGEIVTGYDTALTGAYAAQTYMVTQGSEDYRKYHNDRITVGGKNYKIKVMALDNKADVSLTVSNFNRFVAAGAVTVQTVWSAGGVALSPLAPRARTPVICSGFSKAAIVPPSRYMYLCQPSYPGALVAGVKWYKESVWKGPGKMKLGLLLWDTALGRSSHMDELYDYLKEDLGVEVLPTAFFPLGVKDFTPQLIRMKEEGANLIFMQALGGQYAMLAKDAKRLNVTPNVALMSTLFCTDKKYLELAGDAAEGTYGMWHWKLDVEDDNASNPAVQEMRNAMEKYRGNRYYDEIYYVGWSSEYITHHLLELTIKKYGFPIKGEQVAECASAMEPWNWGLSRSFSGYGGGDRLGWHELRMYQVKKEKITRVSDWIPEPQEFLKRAPWIIGK